MATADGAAGVIRKKKEGDSVRTVIFAPSSRSNSLGRAISMATTATELGSVELWAADDGPVWPAAVKFGVPVSTFPASEWRSMAARIRQLAADEDVLVWISKGLHPLDLIAQSVADAAGVTVVQDFDEDDLALMRDHFRGGVVRTIQRRIDIPPFHPKSPWRVRRSQRRAAEAASLITGTSHAILDVYRTRAPVDASAVRIAHTRRFLPRDRPPVREVADRKGLTLAFLGTIRPHKGLESIVRLAESMPDATFRSYAQSWRPPASVRDHWEEIPSDTPVVRAYRGVDVLVVPQDLTSTVAQTQLSAKVVDAALMARAVVASPTATIEEYCAGVYLPVTDWADAAALAARIRAADLRDLGARLRDVYDEQFSPRATAEALRAALANAPMSSMA